MAENKLNPKEKELVAVGAAIAAGCQKCADFHFRKVSEEGASLEEVEKAVSDATCVIISAKEIMQRKAYALMSVPRKEAAECCSNSSDRVAELVKIGAAVAANCTTNIRKHIEMAKSLGVTSEEMTLAIRMAKAISKKAVEFADEAISNGFSSEEEEPSSTGGCSASRKAQTSQLSTQSGEEQAFTTGCGWG